MSERTKLALVAFDDDSRPFSVTTTDEDGCGADYYDFDWSEAEGTLYYHKSGAGPLFDEAGRMYNPSDSVIWVAPEYRNRIDLQDGQTLLEKLPEGYTSFEEMTANAYSGEVVWCEVCQSYLSERDNNPCRHLTWMDSHCAHIGTGNPNAEGVDYKASLFAVFKTTGIAEPLKRAIEKGNYDIHLWGSMLGPSRVCCWLVGRDYGDAFTDELTDEAESAMADGMAWLLTLVTGKTVEAEKKTLVMIQEFMALNVGGEK